MAAKHVTIHVSISSEAPLLMNNPQMADPTNPLAKELKELTSKRDKTDEDYLAIKKAQFMGAIYWDESVGPYISAEMIEACIRDGAKVNKRGKSVLASVFCVSEMVPLIYDGPRDMEGLFADKNFVATKGVRVQKARVMRTRPVFPSWSLEFMLTCDTRGMSLSSLEAALEEGSMKGLGDYRPRYGRFAVNKFKQI